MHNKTIHMIAFPLLVIGGLNGLLAVLGYNVINMLFGGMSAVEQSIYILIGLAAIYEVATHKKSCRHCSVGGQQEM